MADRARQMLQAAQAVLKASSGLSVLVGSRVYGETPQGPSYPFVLLTCPDGRPFDAADFAGQALTLRVQAFARDGKPGTALGIRAAVFAALNRREDAFGDAGQRVVMIDHAMSANFLEDDGRTWQSVIEFTVTIDE